MPKADLITTPPEGMFRSKEEYYSTLFHELTHSTGHEKRLNRVGVNRKEPVAWGDGVYSQEELVAEMGSSFLCGKAGIEQKTLENQAAYIQNWVKALRGDSRLVIKAAAQAQKAYDYILGVKHENRTEPKSTTEEITA